MYFFCPPFASNPLKQNKNLRQNFCLENLRSLICSTSFTQLNLGSLFNIVWNINFLLKRLLWKIHQISQNQWLPYRKNPGGRICRNCFMCASATSFFVLDCLSVGRNQWFSLHYRGAKVWAKLQAISTLNVD